MMLVSPSIYVVAEDAVKGDMTADENGVARGVVGA
jgi:hypothetical protein